jgi:hypothetical protein
MERGRGEREGRKPLVEAASSEKKGRRKERRVEESEVRLDDGGEGKVSCTSLCGGLEVPSSYDMRCDGKSSASLMPETASPVYMRISCAVWSCGMY